MANKLLAKQPEKKADTPLVPRKDAQFTVSFKYKLQNGYTFKELDISDNKLFQSFLDKVSNMTVSQVNNAFLRIPDTTDTYNGKQILHYKISDKFRIHGIYEDGRFKVLRLDAKHKVHAG